MKINLIASRSSLTITFTIGLPRAKSAEKATGEPKEKIVPDAKSFGLSDEAAAAFLNDEHVVDAYQATDYFDADEQQFREALRMIERKAAHYKVKFPGKNTLVPTRQFAPRNDAAPETK